MTQGQDQPHTTYAIGRPAYAARSCAAAIIGLSAAVGASEMLRPIHLANPGLRVGIDLTMTLCAIASTGLLLSGFNPRRRLADLVLVAAFVSVAIVETIFAVTALADIHAGQSSAALRLGSEALLAIAFAAAALAPGGTVRSVGRRTAAIAGAAAIGTVALTELIAELTLRRGNPDGLIMSGLAAAARQPLALTFVLGSSAVLGAAAIAFVRRAARGDGEARLLAGASILLAAATPYLAFPMAPAHWATAGDALRAAACAVLLALGLRRCVEARRQLATLSARTAVDAERERMARDLHDGLAQDLAFIVNHGQGLNSALGPDHPVSIAARRALAVTRGAIVDLSASEAPTTGAALRAVADELAARFGVHVDVQIAGDDGARLSAAEREEIVRIAREAIVNAVRHGGARKIDVAVDCRGGSLLLRVSDDGCGMPDQVPASDGGFGIPTMRARAESLGGRLTARGGELGGTELEIVISA